MYEMYKDINCRPLRIASWIAATVPRGKGFFPRLLGRIMKPWIHHSIRTRGGVLLPIVPEALDVYTSMLNEGGSWDHWVFRTINDHLAPGAVVYDIGANVGYITLELAFTRKADQIRLVSFEPQEELAANVGLGARVNGLSNIDVWAIAIGSKDEVIPFFATAHSVHATAIAPQERFRARRVTQRSIDSLVEKQEIPPPDWIKIDIEGYELEALRGARNTIRRFRPWLIFEFSWSTIGSGKSGAEFEEFFADVGAYDLCRLDGRTLEGSAWDLPPGGHLDVMARPRRVV